MGYMSSAMAALVLCLVIFVQVLRATAASVRRPSAMYVFGDSTLDVGNNNFLPGPDVPRANKPYYGVDFPSSRPTGRFSNGYNTADYIAKNMGFVCSPPAYLALAPRTDLLVRKAIGTGVSYASGGAGILDSTNAGNNIPLSKQVQYFKATKSQVVAKLGTSAVNRLLSKSVFLFSVGSNDLFVFAQSQNKSSAVHQSDVAALYTSLISNYTATITELYTLGARKLAIINVGMLGCVPAARVYEATGACSDALNQLVAGFDAALSSLLNDIAPRMPGLAYSLADYYGLTEATFANPQAVGYTDIAGACCGGGRLGADADCRPNATVCTERDRHAFWDRVHPSQRAAMLTAQNFYHSRPGQYTAPINFKELAETS